MRALVCGIRGLSFRGGELQARFYGMQGLNGREGTGNMREFMSHTGCCV